MKTYRLDRRFVMRAFGINFVLAGVVAAAAFVIAATDLPDAIRVVATLLAIALLANAALQLALPPVVVRSDSSELRVGGRLTVRPVRVPWTAVESVTINAGRIYLDRGDDNVLVFPLAYVGGRTDELVRDVYDRLNTANGYRRFDPS